MLNEKPKKNSIIFKYLTPNPRGPITFVNDNIYIIIEIIDLVQTRLILT